VDCTVDDDSRSRDALADGPHAARNYDSATRVCLERPRTGYRLEVLARAGFPRGPPLVCPSLFSVTVRDARMGDGCAPTAALA
jgi:hypothetical protein